MAEKVNEALVVIHPAEWMATFNKDPQAPEQKLLRAIFPNENFDTQSTNLLDAITAKIKKAAMEGISIFVLPEECEEDDNVNDLSGQIFELRDKFTIVYGADYETQFLELKRMLIENNVDLAILTGQTLATCVQGVFSLLTCKWRDEDDSFTLVNFQESVEKNSWGDLELLTAVVGAKIDTDLTI